MTTYKGIKGFNIQTVSSDPPAPFTGQVWYNSTSATIKYSGGAIPATWATGNAMGTGREQIAGFGTQTAAVAAGGIPPVATTENYNGTSWTGGVNMLSSLNRAGYRGTADAAWATGDQPTTSTQEYNSFGPGTETITTS